jgi:hypothetical protein
MKIGKTIQKDYHITLYNETVLLPRYLTCERFHEDRDL